ncbi:MAG TPA: MOSC N-terminal beta barrel domain-containing protein [Marmoricola sp.]
MQIKVASIRRYPVKSMGGESLDVVEVDARGLVGDRWYAVTDDQGHLASGKNTTRFRRRDAVFDYAARTVGSDVVVSGAAATWTAGAPDLDAELSRAMATRVRLLPETDVAHQDAGQVSLIGSATLAWCAERWGIAAESRRLRVNLVVATEEPFVEEGWIGGEVGIGGVRLRPVERIERCRMIDIDQDGVRADGRWLKPLGAERDMCVAIYADVVTPGVLRVGDAIEVV